MNPTEQYIYDRDEQVRKNLKEMNKSRWGDIPAIGTDRDLIDNFTEYLVRTNYTKNFTWMGIPILQYPQDLMVMQELIWELKLDWIIETGTAFGGSALFYATCPTKWTTHIMTIDKEFRPHTLEVIHRVSHILGIEGDSISEEIVKKVWMAVEGYRSRMVVLDSNHTHAHVLQELRLYAPLVSVGSYIVVFDTAIEEFGHLDKNQDRPWGQGNNPATAVKEFMEGNDEFVVDKEVEQRALITAASGGWLRRIK